MNFAYSHYLALLIIVKCCIGDQTYRCQTVSDLEPYNATQAEWLQPDFRYGLNWYYGTVSGDIPLNFYLGMLPLSEKRIKCGWTRLAYASLNIYNQSSKKYVRFTNLKPQRFLIGTGPVQFNIPEQWGLYRQPKYHKTVLKTPVGNITLFDGFGLFPQGPTPDGFVRNGAEISNTAYAQSFVRSVFQGQLLGQKIHAAGYWEQVKTSYDLQIPGRYHSWVCTYLFPSQWSGFVCMLPNSSNTVYAHGMMVTPSGERTWLPQWSFKIDDPICMMNTGKINIPYCYRVTITHPTFPLKARLMPVRKGNFTSYDNSNKQLSWIQSTHMSGKIGITPIKNVPSVTEVVIGGIS